MYLLSDIAIISYSYSFIYIYIHLDHLSLLQSKHNAIVIAIMILSYSIYEYNIYNIFCYISQVLLVLVY